MDAIPAANLVESLNTVMDDNKALCLANSERIELTPSTRFLLETPDFRVSSPATVSRLVIVHMEPQSGTLGWWPLLAVATG